MVANVAESRHKDCGVSREASPIRQLSRDLQEGVGRDLQRSNSSNCIQKHRILAC